MYVVYRCSTMVYTMYGQLAADLQAQNVSHCDAFWACISAIFDCIWIVALWSESENIVALCIIKVAHPWSIQFEKDLNSFMCIGKGPLAQFRLLICLHFSIYLSINVP